MPTKDRTRLTTARRAYYQRALDLWRLLQALLEIPRHTLWCVGNMEEGPFARLVLPQPNGGYTGGYSEAYADTPAEAVRIALEAARKQG